MQEAKEKGGTARLPLLAAKPHRE
jgi:hypothetical protein